MIWSLKQSPQAQTWYCGPAAAKSIIDSRTGRNMSQWTLANELWTTQSEGTSWRKWGTNPMLNVLNNRMSTFYYAAYNATTNDTESLRYKAVTSVNNDYGVAANIYAPDKSLYRLPGHPNRAIEHWIAIDSYYDNGYTIGYAEPVYGSNISWASDVVQYPRVSTYKLAYLIWERGVIW